jgi:hypothetical protein
VAHTIHRGRLALREGEEIDPVPERTERPDEVEDGERRAPHLEERLRGKEEDPQ